MDTLTLQTIAMLCVAFEKYFSSYLQPQTSWGQRRGTSGWSWSVGERTIQRVQACVVRVQSPWVVACLHLQSFWCWREAAVGSTARWQPRWPMWVWNVDRTNQFDLSLQKTRGGGGGGGLTTVGVREFSPFIASVLLRVRKNNDRGSKPIASFYVFSPKRIKLVIRWEALLLCVAMQQDDCNCSKQSPIWGQSATAVSGYWPKPASPWITKHPEQLQAVAFTKYWSTDVFNTFQSKLVHGFEASDLALLRSIKINSSEIHLRPLISCANNPLYNASLFWTEKSNAGNYITPASLFWKNIWANLSTPKMWEREKKKPWTNIGAFFCFFAKISGIFPPTDPGIHQPFAWQLKLVPFLKKTTHLPQGWCTQTATPVKIPFVYHRWSSRGGHTFVCPKLADLLFSCLVNLWHFGCGQWPSGLRNDLTLTCAEQAEEVGVCGEVLLAMCTPVHIFDHWGWEVLIWPF